MYRISAEIKMLLAFKSAYLTLVPHMGQRNRDLFTQAIWMVSSCRTHLRVTCKWPLAQPGPTWAGLPQFCCLLSCWGMAAMVSRSLPSIHVDVTSVQIKYHHISILHYIAVNNSRWDMYIVLLLPSLSRWGNWGTESYLLRVILWVNSRVRIWTWCLIVSLFVLWTGGSRFWLFYRESVV